MADSPGQRLANTLGPRFRAAMAVPQEDLSTKLARLLMGGAQQPQTPPPAYQQPYTGLRNTPQTLPPFVSPGSAMDEADPLGPAVPFTPPQAAAPAPTPQAQALPSPTAATQPQLAPQGAVAPTVVPPMPAPVTVRDDVLKAAKEMLAQNLLPEQWKGAFTAPQGWPR